MFRALSGIGIFVQPPMAVAYHKLICLTTNWASSTVENTLNPAFAANAIGQHVASHALLRRSARHFSGFIHGCWNTRRREIGEAQASSTASEDKQGRQIRSPSVDSSAKNRVVDAEVHMNDRYAFLLWHNTWEPFNQPIHLRMAGVSDARYLLSPAVHLMHKVAAWLAKVAEPHRVGPVQCTFATASDRRFVAKGIARDRASPR